MLEQINRLCASYIHELACRSNATESVNFGAGEDYFHIQIGDGEKFDVVVDDFSVSDDDDTDEGTTLMRREFVRLLDEDSPHGDILDACLDAISQNGDIQPKIRDLTTDGDGKDCEAIFDVEGYGYVILKVR